MERRESEFYRFLGISGHNCPLFADVARDERFDLFHLRYNAAHRGAEQDIFSRMPEQDRPGLVTYTATRWGDLLNPRKMPPGESPLRGSDCYRFAMSHPTVDVCVTGPKNREQMREALKALDLGPLSEEELARTRRIGDHVHTNYRRL